MRLIGLLHNSPKCHDIIHRFRTSLTQRVTLPTIVSRMIGRWPDVKTSYYCWWLKSCIGWEVVYSSIYKIICIYFPGGAGFLPSTVVSSILQTKNWHFSFTPTMDLPPPAPSGSTYSTKQLDPQRTKAVEWDVWWDCQVAEASSSSSSSAASSLAWKKSIRFGCCGRLVSTW